MVAAELKISQIYGRGKELQLELPDFLPNLIATKVRDFSWKLFLVDELNDN